MKHSEHLHLKLWIFKNAECSNSFLLFILLNLIGVMGWYDKEILDIISQSFKGILILLITEKISAIFLSRQ